MNLLMRHLVTLFSGREKQPWEKGNSWLVKAGIADLSFVVTALQYLFGYDGAEHLTAGMTDLSFNVQKVTYHDMYDGAENLTAGVTDLSFVVTKV